MSSVYTSALRLYSVGRVAENLPLSSKVALVIPLEILSLFDGELKDSEVKVTSRGVDDLGNPYQVEIASNSTLECTWLQQGSNSTTPPNVRRGERVAIYRFADADEFYWTPLGLDDDLRRLETKIWRWSNIPDGVSNDKRTHENSYTFEVSTHRSLVTLTTSKSNGEPFGYVMQFNCAEGAYTVTDDVGNYFELDSSETKITMHNADGTLFSCDKEDLIGYAPRDMSIKVDRDFLLDVGRDMEVKVVGDMRYSCTNLDWSASSSFTVSSPTITLDGKVKVTGDTDLQSKLSVSGTTSLKSATTANGITSSAPIKGPSNTI